MLLGSIIILVISIIFFSCRKEKDFLPDTLQKPVSQVCEMQTDNPTGRSYYGHSVFLFDYSKKNCGLLPLSSRNYWVYQDSVYADGVFDRVQNDTLRFTSWKSLSDGLIWWESNINIGLPEILYANDTAFFGLENRLFDGLSAKDVKKGYSLFTGDSIRYLASFEDIAAQGRSLKLKTSFKTPAGTFNDCVYFEKNARSYRKDQVYFKPELGVLKYILEKAPIGTGLLKLQQVSTLIAVHIE